MYFSRRPFCATVALFAVIVSAPLARAELLTNGNLETFSFGSPNNWNYFGGDPGSGQSAVVSPFTNVYPPGTSSMLLVDGVNLDLTPMLSQSFTPQTGQISYSADFLLGNLTGAPTYLAYTGNHATAGLVTAFIFVIDDSSNQLVADGFGGSQSVATLSPNTWYQIAGTADVVTHTFSGTVTPFGGSPIPFGPLGWNPFAVDLRGVEISDSFSLGSNAYKNGDLYVDNFSVVPEPGALTAIGIACAMLVRRGRRI